jgi:hypothetical protein
VFWVREIGKVVELEDLPLPVSLDALEVEGGPKNR